MGFVTGIVANNNTEGLFFCRTDNSGAYSWDKDNNRWIPLMDGIETSKLQYLNVESIATDDSDPDVLYVATGMNLNAANPVIRSFNGGKTWTETPLKTNNGSNELYRKAGERLAVDPNKGGKASGIVYFGTRTQGLYRSFNSGSSWEKVEGGLPASTVNPGFNFILFDKTKTKNGKTQVVYAGVFGSGIWKSSDAGNTWVNIGGTLKPLRGCVAANGNLYVVFGENENTYNQGGLLKYNGSQWIDITPQAGTNYGGVSVYKNSNRLIVNTWGGDIYFANDTSSSVLVWKKLAVDIGKAGADYPAWYPDVANPSYPDCNFFKVWNANVVFDPFNDKKVWMCSGWGVMQCVNIDSPVTLWRPVMENLEQLVVFDIKSPAGGNAELYSASADMAGFVHKNPKVIPLKNEKILPQKWGLAKSIDICYSNPDIVVYAGNQFSGNGTLGKISHDGGLTFDDFQTFPGTGVKNGNIALSSSSSAINIVWAPENAGVSFSKDGGKTWKLSNITSPVDRVKQTWAHSQVLVSDKTLAGTFYLLQGDKLLRSNNGGETFLVQKDGLPNDGEWTAAYLKAAPGIQGLLLASFGKSRGLYRSYNGGADLALVPGVDKSFRISFGACVPPSPVPAVYILGIINAEEGLFRSDNITDAIPQWKKISPDSLKFPKATCLEGDLQYPGRIYIGSEGRGVQMGYLENEIKLPLHYANVKSAEIFVYPNPVSGTRVCKLPSGFENAREYFLYDNMGRLVKRGAVENNTIDFSNILPAAYILTIIRENFHKLNTVIIIQ